MNTRCVSLLVVASSVALAACGPHADAGRNPRAGSAGDARGVRIVVAFVSERAVTSCAGGARCTRRLAIEGAGAATLDDRGAVRSARLASADYARLERLANDDGVRAALADDAPCAAGQAGAAVHRVELRTDGDATMSREIQGCEGEAFAAMRALADELEARYFP